MELQSGIIVERGLDTPKPITFAINSVITEGLLKSDHDQLLDIARDMEDENYLIYREDGLILHTYRKEMPENRRRHRTDFLVVFKDSTYQLFIGEYAGPNLEQSDLSKSSEFIDSLTLASPANPKVLVERLIDSFILGRYRVN